MKGKKYKVAHMTTVHPRTDTRIYLKELKTLALNEEYDLNLFVADGEGDYYDRDSQIFIHDINKKKPNTRIYRALITSLVMLVKVRKFKPNIVHFHDSELIPIGLILKLSGIKVIYDVHENLYKQILGKSYIPMLARYPIAILMRFLEYLGAIVFDRLVVATPEIQKLFPRNKTILVQNFPFKNEFAVIDNSFYENRNHNLCFIGYITKIRGLNEVIDSLNYMKNSTFKFHLAGKFESQRYENYIRNKKESKHIKFYNWVDRNEMLEILNQSKVGIVTYLPFPNHINAQPNKLFEYMSAGIPVIASDFPLWRQIIENEKCGLLVDPRNPQQIAEALDWIFDNPKEAKIMGDNGKKAVKNKYNWDLESAKLLGSYLSLLKK